VGTRLTEFQIPSPPVASFEAVDFDGVERFYRSLFWVAICFVAIFCASAYVSCLQYYLTDSVLSCPAGDGLTDLFLRTRRGIYAWRQVPRPGALPFVFLLGFLVLAAGLAFVLSTQQAVYGAPKRSTDME
jgi:hypothetical protein